jgi:ribosomal-protein-alanine N-acetyltransferase
MNVINKLLSFEDIDQVFELERDIFGVANQDSIVNSLHSKTNKYFVSVLEGKIIAFCNIHFFDIEAEIINIGVNEGFRKKNISSQLLEFIINKSKSVKKYFLEVRKSNLAAINLYEKHYFLEIGVRKKYYKDGEDAIIMQRTVE